MPTSREPGQRILVINCGSSSLKYEVYDMPSRHSLGKGLVDRIGIDDGSITHEGENGKYEQQTDIPTHKRAMELVIDALTDEHNGIIGTLDEISGVGHRVVHGGEAYSASVIIDADVEAAIERNIELAPIHNPANLTGIREARAVFPKQNHVAVFDTAFHQTIPPAAYLYGLPRELYDKYRIRRYGFHGTSHRYVANQAAVLCKRSPDNTNLITCHLGNGCSVTAIKNGRSIDTSMGFTPLEGLVMGTRSGDIDPAIIFFLLERGMTPDELNTMLNKESGLKGLSGISNDLRDIEEAAELGDRNAADALDVYAHKVRQYIGAYAAEIVKVDILVFTGGVGQFGTRMRERICRRLENLGIVMDYRRNLENGPRAGIISMDYSPTTIVVQPTNEELQIAIDTFGLL
ncbi:MAG: acetate kinase [Spirochaetaceae bacterium]|nr:MAG: acetate kinase [Spirochaetaceae bacterium]